jgi:hypothetical protein
MSDSIELDRRTTHTSLNIEWLIAFYPKEHFMIFTGYCFISDEQLPKRISFYRASQDNGNLRYDIEIIGIHRKHLEKEKEEKKEKDQNHICEDDDCCCSITFSPTYFVILEFNIINIYHNNISVKNISDAYCLDKRYNSGMELCKAYLKLPTIENGIFVNYKPTEEYETFYKEFYEQL